MKKYLTTVTLITISLAAMAQADKCFSEKRGETLTIGNNLVERVFSWNEGAVSTIALKDVAAGTVLETKGQGCDFRIGDAAVEDATLTSIRIPAGALTPAKLVVRIQYRTGGIEIRREYTICDDVPAIACRTFLKGAPDGSMKDGLSDMVIDRLDFEGRNWHVRAVEFQDMTDDNDNLVSEKNIIAYRHPHRLRGNLLFVRDGIGSGGFFFLKEAPCTAAQTESVGHDFIAEYGSFQVVGSGIGPADIRKDRWTQVYGCVTGVTGKTELSALSAVRLWQKTLRRQEDMVMMNTWGDRSQDAKVNELFCLEELEKAARLGISVFQIDDGWQCGKSPASATSGGSFDNIWNNPCYWTPDPVKFPRGLAPVIERAVGLGIEIGLWFNPSVQNEFEDWEKDAAILKGMYEKYGIRIFKIDGLVIPTKKAETNLRRMLDSVREATGDRVMFNIDVTAGRRAGYNYFGEYGNIFLENRYTDWGNYYPCHTLRNLWQLSRYIPAENLQIEFLNPWRNADKYPEGDPFAPCNYRFEYLAAITFAAQPLAWLEASNLPEEAFAVGDVVRGYRDLAHSFHSGVILPVGEEPSGRSWTGFQSILSEKEGYLLVFREDTDRKGRITTWLPEGCRVKLTPVLGHGRKRRVRAGKDGMIRIRLKEKNSYTLYRYSL